MKKNKISFNESRINNPNQKLVSPLEKIEKKTNKKRDLKNKILNVFGHTDKKTNLLKGIFNLGSFSKAGGSLTTQELLGTTYFVRSVQMIANDIACLNWNHFNLKKNKWYLNNKSEINYLLNIRPNLELSAFEFKKILIWNIFLYGYAAILIIKDKKTSQIESLIPVFSNYIKREIRNGKPIYTIDLNSTTDNSVETTKDYNLNLKDEYSENEIIWLSYELIDNYRNTEFKNFFHKTIQKVQASDDAILNSVKNDLGIQMSIKVKGVQDKTTKERIAESLETTIETMRRTGQAAFIHDDKWEISSTELFKPSKITDEIRKNIGVEFASIFGIPPVLLGIDASNSYDKQAQIQKSYYDKALKPLLTNIVQKFSFSLFDDSTKNKISYSVLELSGLDASTKIEFISKAVNAGIMTANEGRENIGLSPNSGDAADLLLINSALQPIQLISDKVSADIDKIKAETVNLKNQPKITINEKK